MQSPHQRMGYLLSVSNVHTNFALIPADRSNVILCTVYDYFLVAGPVEFVKTAVGGNIKAAWDSFEEAASDPRGKEGSKRSPTDIAVSTVGLGNFLVTKPISRYYSPGIGRPSRRIRVSSKFFVTT